MLRTLAIATAIGAGVGSAVNIPEAAEAGLDPRSNTPPSYFCSSNTKKCSKQKPAVTAYCSSYLSIPKVTKTTTKTVFSTKTNIATKVTATITKPPKVITSTITSCAPPAVTMAPVDGDDGEENSLPDADGGENVRRNAPPTYKPAVYKPSCLDSHKDKNLLSAACKCYSIKPSTTTVTKTTTQKKTVTSTKKTATTIAGGKTTTFVLPAEPTFIIGNDAGGYAVEDCLINDENERIGFGRLYFESEQTNALLFSLTADKSLRALEGSLGDAFEAVPQEGEDPNYTVRIGDPEENEVTAPLSCSISQDPDGTCPLDCSVSSDGKDVNQGSGFDDWFLAPSGAVVDLTYKTYAVTRSDPSQRGGGGCFQLRGGRRKA